MPFLRRPLVGAAFLLLNLPMSASADDANAKLVQAKLAYDTLGAAKTVDERLAILSDVEAALSSIVHDDPGSDLAVKLVSGDKVAGMSWDIVRVQLDQLRTFAATETSLIYYVTTNGRRVLCWNQDRLFCATTAKTFQDDGTFVIEDMAAGLIPSHAVIAFRQRTSTRSLTVDDHALADYLFRYQPMSSLSDLRLQADNPGGALPSETNYTVTYEPFQFAAKPLTINGESLPYQFRTVRRTINDDNPEHYFSGPNGEKLKTLTETQYFLPTLSMSAIQAADFDLIRSGSFASGRVGVVDALFIFMTDMVNPESKSADTLTQANCLIGQIKDLSSPPPDLAKLAEDFVSAADPVEAVKVWSSHIDRDAGKKLETPSRPTTNRR